MCTPQPRTDSLEPVRAAGVALELADIVRAYRPAYEQTHALSYHERAVLDAVEDCRTAALGGHLDVCLDCGSVSGPSYNSCRNRHCPKCPAVAQARWIASRLERVLPCHYFHVVFTLPAELRALARNNPKGVYGLLFRCAADTLLALGHDPRHLGGELGVTAVLHTWTQKLAYHPHLHCIVTGGALSPDGREWIAARPNFLFPVHVMGKLFRGKMLDALRRELRAGKLRVADPQRCDELLGQLYRKNWNVYCKRPFGNADQVIRYLGQYTHRVAISNHRLLAMDEHGVSFRTKTGELVTLDAIRFLDRWLAHVLPPGFTKIRHYGLMSSSHATTRLETARALLTKKLEPDARRPDPPDRDLHKASWRDIIGALTGIQTDCCSRCGSTNLARSPLPRCTRAARAPPKAA